MNEAEIIRARIKELQRMLAALQANLQTLEREKADQHFPPRQQPKDHQAND
jgi:prefoldin subunit 5